MILIYAYVRHIAGLDCQTIQVQLNTYHVDQRHIFYDEEAKTQPELHRLISLLKPNDCIIIRSLYDLSDDCEEMSRLWHVLCKEIQVDVVVLDTPMIDTRRNETNIDSRFVIDMVEEILSYIGKNQKAIQHVKQIKGIEEAKEKGVQFGRPKKLSDTQYKDVMYQYHHKLLSLKEAMTILNVKKTSFYKYYKEYIENQGTHKSDKT